MKKLTLKNLIDMKPREIIASGFQPNSAEGIFMTDKGGELKWVAVRGAGYHDWAIYCHWSYSDIAFITSQGDKVRDKETIKKLVPCNKEAFEMYRY